jgi:hypothetical protein
MFPVSLVHYSVMSYSAAPDFVVAWPSHRSVEDVGVCDNQNGHAGLNFHIALYDHQTSMNEETRLT